MKTFIKILETRIASLCLMLIMLFIAIIAAVIEHEVVSVSGDTTVTETVHNPEKTSVETTTETTTYLSCVPIETEVTTEKTTTVETTEYIEPVVYFDVPLDHDLQDHIFAECEKHGIDPAIIIAMIERETDFRSHLVGDKGNSFGLMQINKKWHIERMEKLGVTDLLDPYQNVTVGIDYLAENYRRGGTLEWALMAYNGGPSYARRLTSEGIVSAYAQGVLERSEELKLNK